MIVNQVLKTKGNEIYSIPSNISVYDALKVMGNKNIGALLVIENNILVGILTERDYARKIVLKNKTSKDTLVKEIMDIDNPQVTINDKIEYCLELMSIFKIRHLPVFNNENLIGVISMSDVVNAIIESQKNIIEHLNSYITQ